MKLWCKSLFVHQALLSVSHFLATLVFGVVLFTFLGYTKPKEMVFRWFSRAEIKRWWWWRCMHNHVKVPWESCFGCPPEIIFMPDTTNTIRNPMLQKPQWTKIENVVRQSHAEIKRWWWWRCIHNHVKVPWEPELRIPLWEKAKKLRYVYTQYSPITNDGVRARGNATIR